MQGSERSQSLISERLLIVQYGYVVMKDLRTEAVEKATEGILK